MRLLPFALALLTPSTVVGEKLATFNSEAWWTYVSMRRTTAPVVPHCCEINEGICMWDPIGTHGAVCWSAGDNTAFPTAVDRNVGWPLVPFGVRESVFLLSPIPQIPLPFNCPREGSPQRLFF